MVTNGKMKANLDGDFVIFMLGMRFNKIWAIHKWFPVLRAMPKMLKELGENRELGLLHYESWFGRTTILVQYWRSKEQLLAYAKNNEAQHLPAWKAFNKAIGTDGSVGIWHETYLVTNGTYENIYGNMPPFGLGVAGKLEPIGKAHETFQQRLETK